MLLHSKEFECPKKDGGTKKFILGTFPAVAGREIIAGYPLSGIPKLGDYKVNEEMMLKLMSHVAVPIDGREEPLQLTTRALVDNHCESWEMLARIEMEMLSRNCSFFASGQALSFFRGIAQTILIKISEMLTPLLAQLSKAEKPPSTS